MSDISDDDNDDNDEVADSTRSTIYQENSNASELELDLPVQNQQTYLVFESALLLLFSICFCVQKYPNFC